MNGYSFTITDFTNTHRNKLLWMLTLTKDVHRVCNVHWKTVCVLIGNSKFFTTCLRCTIRICGVITVVFPILDSIRSRTKHFISAEVNKPFKISLSTGKLKNVAGSYYIIKYKLHRIFNTTVNMRTSSKMENIINLTDFRTDKRIKFSFEVMMNNSHTLTNFRIKRKH